MSYILRHHPEDFDLEIKADGSVSVNALLNALSKKFPDITLQDIEKIVKGDKKGRFSFLEEGKSIRANYGHSIEGVNPEYKAVKPPEFLYHGTTRKAKDKILKEGLKPMGRNYTHLSINKKEAIKVGKRRDKKPVVFKIKAREAYEDGKDFYKTAKEIYLTDMVPPVYILE